VIGLSLRPKQFGENRLQCIHPDLAPLDYKMKLVPGMHHAVEKPAVFVRQQVIDTFQSRICLLFPGRKSISRGGTARTMIRVSKLSAAREQVRAARNRERSFFKSLKQWPTAAFASLYSIGYCDRLPE
jgi:hypothetical protein